MRNGLPPSGGSNIVARERGKAEGGVGAKAGREEGHAKVVDVVVRQIQEREGAVCSDGPREPAHCRGKTAHIALRQPQTLQHPILLQQSQHSFQFLGQSVPSCEHHLAPILSRPHQRPGCQVPLPRQSNYAAGYGKTRLLVRLRWLAVPRQLNGGPRWVCAVAEIPGPQPPFLLPAPLHTILHYSDPMVLPGYHLLILNESGIAIFPLDAEATSRETGSAIQARDPLTMHHFVVILLQQLVEVAESSSSHEREGSSSDDSSDPCQQCGGVRQSAHASEPLRALSAQATFAR
eukprot:1883679-Rhodomonas_salina.1